MEIVHRKRHGAQHSMMVFAYRSFNDRTVVAKGWNLERVLKKARNEGVLDPVIHFEPPVGARIIC